MVNDLASNEILGVNGILNGTTNYILTRMIEAGATFEDALKEAQAKGYAEANPAADVEGLDAARKIVILAALSFGTLLSPDDIFCEGITKLTLADVAVAKAFGCSLKLIGHTEKVNGKVLAMVSPRMVPNTNPLSGISDVFNGILVDANMLGECMFYGKGAGKLPTASAVVADIIDIVSSRTARAPHFTVATAKDYADFGAYVCRSCFSFENKEGAAERLKAVFGDANTVVVDDRIAVLSAPVSESEAEALAKKTGLTLLSRIRLI
jgi:homoserine dehydrogenase